MSWRKQGNHLSLACLWRSYYHLNKGEEQTAPCPLELRGEGFAKALELVKVAKVKDFILAIRKELLPS